MSSLPTTDTKLSLSGDILIESGNNLFYKNISGVYPKLPVGVYRVKFDEDQGFFLQTAEPFTLPSKIYGTDMSIVDRWLTGWTHTPENSNMGIILSGIKGSGKTITAKNLCIKSNMPVLIVETPFRGSNFNSFMSNPTFSNSIVFIDEFEKIYSATENENNSKVQNDLLSLFDGTAQSHLLFVLTINSHHQVSDFLLNRLGRVRYYKIFESISMSALLEVIEDKLENKEYVDDMLSVISCITEPTMDIVCGIIDESNRFKESPLESVKHLCIVKNPIYYDIYERHCTTNQWVQVESYQYLEDIGPDKEVMIDLDRNRVDHLPGYRADMTSEELEFLEGDIIQTGEGQYSTYRASKKDIGVYYIDSLNPEKMSLKITPVKHKTPLAF